MPSLCPNFFRATIIIEAQTKQILQEVADMIVLKILAAPFVVALTLLAYAGPKRHLDRWWSYTLTA